jgi:hypothetical protein
VIVSIGDRRALARAGWASLSRQSGRGTLCLTFQVDLNVTSVLWKLVTGADVRMKTGRKCEPELLRLLDRCSFARGQPLRHLGHRRHEALRVFMARTGQDLLGSSGLHDLPLVQDRNAVANPGYRR